MATWPGKDSSTQLQGNGQVAYSLWSSPPCGKTALKVTRKGPPDRLARTMKIAAKDLAANMRRHMSTCKVCRGDSN